VRDCVPRKSANTESALLFDPDWIYKGSYDLPTDATERLDVLEEMYRLVRHWDFVESDLFNGLTRELIRSIGTLTYGNRTSYYACSPIFRTND
jgi:hypothetical protein